MRLVAIVIGVLIVAVVAVVVFDSEQAVSPNAADQKALSGQFINSPPKSY